VAWHLVDEFIYGEQGNNVQLVKYLNLDLIVPHISPQQLDIRVNTVILCPHPRRPATITAANSAPRIIFDFIVFSADYLCV